MSFEFIPIITSAVVGYLVGGLWYSPLLFSKFWIEATELTDKDFEIAKPGMGGTMIMSFGTILALALALYTVITLVDADSIGEAALISLFVAFGFIVTTRLSDLLYSKHGHSSRKAQMLFLIQSGYALVQLVLMGIVISLF